LKAGKIGINQGRYTLGDRGRNFRSIEMNGRQNKLPAVCVPRANFVSSGAGRKARGSGARGTINRQKKTSTAQSKNQKGRWCGFFHAVPRLSRSPATGPRKEENRRQRGKPCKKPKSRKAIRNKQNSTKLALPFRRAEKEEGTPNAKYCRPSLVIWPNQIFLGAENTRFPQVIRRASGTCPRPKIKL